MLPEIKTIVYATDLEAGSSHVFRYALSQAERYQSRLVVVHAMEPLSRFGQSLVELHISHQNSEKMHEDARDQVRADITKRIHDFCEEEASLAEENLVQDILVIEGQPDQVILDEARTLNADMIIMGTHRHSVAGEMLLGSTAQKVVHSSDIPTLLVRIPE